MLHRPHVALLYGTFVRAWQQRESGFAARLFFDLVFVFALTQVTQLMPKPAHLDRAGPGPARPGRAVVGLGAYAWLTNYISAEEDRERLLMFAVMGAFLVAALATPDAFGDDALLFGWPTRSPAGCTSSSSPRPIRPHPGDAIRRLAWTAVPGPALLIVASFLDGPVQALVWVLALAIDFSGPFVFGVNAFRVSPAHLPALRADRDHRSR